MAERACPVAVAVAAALVGAGAGAADMADMQGMAMPEFWTFVGADRLETQFRDAGETLLWDVEAWAGGNLNRLWLRAEGERVSGAGTEEAELRVLYGRAIRPFWDVQVGLRHDIEPGPSRSFAMLALNGLAPYNFDVNAALFLSEDGDASARLELEYDLFLTQRWILQPRVELDAAFDDVAGLGIESGLTGLEAGLRLRYLVRPEITPYAGFEYLRSLGATADRARAAGDDTRDFAWVAGLSFWF